ncbi:MAG: DUF2461 domain-containing protein [Bacteroidota bacterium]
MYFQPEFLKFLKGLSENNSKAWFDQHRAEYEKYVKAPFKSFVEEMMIRIREFEPQLNMNPRDAMFRINRDVRFSKNKAPYNIHVSALFTTANRKSEIPGFYVRFSHDAAAAGGGGWDLSAESLKKVRQEIVEFPDELNNLQNEPAFKKLYGELKGEKNKVIPKEFKETFAAQPLVANKQFYYWAELPANIVLKENLAEYLMEYYHAGQNVNEFLKSVMRNE